MATCATCNKVIVFGGVREKGVRFCSEKCRQQGEVAVMATELPEDVLSRALEKVHLGTCPQCGRDGPVDLIKAHRCMSFILFTSASTVPLLACRRCAFRHVARSSLITFVAGWWGFPLGIILTPVQLMRNVAALGRLPTKGRFSTDFKAYVRLLATQELLHREAQREARRQQRRDADATSTTTHPSA